MASSRLESPAAQPLEAEEPGRGDARRTARESKREAKAAARAQRAEAREKLAAAKARARAEAAEAKAAEQVDSATAAQVSPEVEELAEAAHDEPMSLAEVLERAGAFDREPTGVAAVEPPVDEPTLQQAAADARAARDAERRAAEDAARAAEQAEREAETVRAAQKAERQAAAEKAEREAAAAEARADERAEKERARRQRAEESAAARRAKDAEQAAKRDAKLAERAAKAAAPAEQTKVEQPKAKDQKVKDRKVKQPKAKDHIVEAPREPKASLAQRLGSLVPGRSGDSEPAGGSSSGGGRRAVSILAGLVGALGLICSVILAFGALLVALDADGGSVYDVVSGISDVLVGPLRDVFSFSGTNADMKEALVAWGTGSIIYLVVGVVVQSMLRSAADD